MFSVRRRIEPGRLSRSVRLALCEAQIEGVNSHDLWPHVCENPRAERNRSLQGATVAGHKSPTTMQRDAYHYPESLRDGAEILDRLRESGTVGVSMRRANYVSDWKKMVGRVGVEPTAR